MEDEVKDGQTDVAEKVAETPAKVEEPKPAVKVKKAKKAGEPFPVKKVQLKAYPKTKKVKKYTELIKSSKTNRLLKAYAAKSPRRMACSGTSSSERTTAIMMSTKNDT